MKRLTSISKHFVSAEPEEEPVIEGKPPQGVPVDPSIIERAKKRQAQSALKKDMIDWRSKATIDPLAIAQFVLGELYPLHKQIHDFYATELHFQYSDYWSRSKEEQRGLTNLLLVKFLKRFPVTPERYENEPWFLATLGPAIGSIFGSVGTKIAVHYSLYIKSIHTLGTEKHKKYVERGLRLADIGCFALTEISHGSNVQGLLTTAIFDENEKGFVINTPNARAAKFWIGGASQTANMAIVGANLIVKDRNYGIHMFLVQLRNHLNHELMPGVTISDCGDKMGLNGIDNGMIFFRNVIVPLDSLLDKITQVSPSGHVTSVFEKTSARFAVQLGGLCDGRVKLCNNQIFVAQKCVAIVLRFATVRKQFGDNPEAEHNLLSYEQYQSRVFPIAAWSTIAAFASREINKLWMKNWMNVLDPKNKEVKEMHALISIMKPLLTWWNCESLSECRQALGGYGYLSISMIPTAIADSHVSMTWEGDNYVLINQTARFVLKAAMKAFGTKSPQKYKTVEYLWVDDPEDIFKSPLEDYPSLLADLDVIGRLLSYRAKRSAEAAMKTFQNNLSEAEPFSAWNMTVPYGFTDLAIHYGELYIFQTALRIIRSCQEDENRMYMERLLRIFGLTKLKASWAYLGDKLSRDALESIHNILLKTFLEIKYDVVSSFDEMVGSDESLNSVFGHKDGDIYNRLLSKLNGEQSNFGKPKEWKQVWESRFSY